MSTFDERRRARASWPVRKIRLGEEELTDPRDTSTVDERLAMVWMLTCQQWAFAGLEIPTYSRDRMPGRSFASHDDGPERDGSLQDARRTSPTWRLSRRCARAEQRRIADRRGRRGAPVDARSVVTS